MTLRGWFFSLLQSSYQGAADFRVVGSAFFNSRFMRKEGKSLYSHKSENISLQVYFIDLSVWPMNGIERKLAAILVPTGMEVAPDVSAVELWSIESSA